MKQVNQGGRRQWSLKWSFIDKANALPKMTDGNMFAEDIIDSYPDSLSNGTMSDSIIGTMAQLSMGFNLPFIFQPDNTEQSFALVKANQKSISLKQVASGTYDISLKLTEVW